MVQVACRFYHHFDTPLDLFRPFIFDDPHGEAYSGPAVVHTFELHTAQLLVIRNNVRTRCRGVQLLAPIPLPERILRVPRTPSREIRRTGTAPRCQQPRSTDHVPQLSRRLLASS